VRGDIWHARDCGEIEEDGGGESDEKPIEGAARRCGFAGGLAAVHASFDEFGGKRIAIGFAAGGGAPLRAFFRRSAGERDGGDAENHEQRAADDLRVCRRAAAVEFAEDEHAPK